jgi:uncharacterized protein YggE
LNKAVEDARARAEAAASGAGRSIDRVIRIEDQRAAGFVPRPIPMPMMSATRAEHMEVTPVSTGQIEIRANVILTAALK